MAYSKDKNPFYTDDYDDSDFGKSSGVKNRYVTSGGAGTSPWGDVDDDEFLRGGSHSQPQDPYDRIQALKQESMNNQLDSTQRALASIYDSEAIGISTAEVIHTVSQLL